LQSYHVRPIAKNDIDVAFVLVDAAGYGLLPGGWDKFCQLTIDGRHANAWADDIVVALDSQKRIKGLFVSQVSENALFGRTLDVPIFIAISAADEIGVIESLLQELTAKAENTESRMLRVWTPGGESWERVTGSLMDAREFKGVQIAVRAERAAR
jgi:hypothetical protein